MTRKKATSQPATSTKAVATNQGGAPAAAALATKASALLELLKQEGGATLEQMMAATGWQKHSVRGFLAGALKKRLRVSVQSSKVDGVRTYRAETAA